MDQIAAMRRECEEYMTSNYQESGDNCGKTMDYILEVGGGVFTYDARRFDYDWDSIQ